MADINDLAQQIAFLQAGGAPKPNYGLEIANTAGKFAIDYTSIIKNVLDAKKTQLESEKLKQEMIPPEQTIGIPSMQSDQALRQKWETAQANPTPVTPMSPFASPREAKLAELKAQGLKIPGALLALPTYQSKELAPFFTHHEAANPLDTQGAIASKYASREFIKTIVPELPEGSDISIGELKQRIAGGKQEDLNKNRDVLSNDRQDRLVNTYSNQMENNYILKELNKQGIGLDTANQLAGLAQSGNTVAGTALGMKQARGLGEVGVLTETDVTRYVTSGQLGRKGADILSRWMQGKPTDATLEEIIQINGVIQDVMRSKIQPVYDRYVNRLSKALNIAPDQASNLLDVPYGGMVKGKKPQTGTTTQLSQPVTATNPKTGQKIQSLDGGKTWQPVQ